jgi:hypothetical protein
VKWQFSEVVLGYKSNNAVINIIEKFSQLKILLIITLVRAIHNIILVNYCCFSNAKLNSLKQFVLYHPSSGIEEGMRRPLRSLKWITITLWTPQRQWEARGIVFFNSHFLYLLRWSCVFSFYYFWLMNYNYMHPWGTMWCFGICIQCGKIKSS